MEKFVSDFMNGTNAILAMASTLLVFALGEHWYLFIGYLVLNVIDCISGTMGAYLSGKSSSVEGTKGLLKKLGYWLMIVVAFLMSSLFIEIGRVIHVDLGVTSAIGWFVLCYLIINEVRSIIENLVECGYHPPKILTKGLEVANRVIEEADDILDDADKDS